LLTKLLKGKRNINSKARDSLLSSEINHIKYLLVNNETLIGDYQKILVTHVTQNDVLR